MEVMEGEGTEGTRAGGRGSTLAREHDARLRAALRAETEWLRVRAGERGESGRAERPRMGVGERRGHGMDKE